MRALKAAHASALAAKDTAAGVLHEQLVASRADTERQKLETALANAHATSLQATLSEHGQARAELQLHLCELEERIAKCWCRGEPKVQVPASPPAALVLAAAAEAGVAARPTIAASTSAAEAEVELAVLDTNNAAFTSSQGYAEQHDVAKGMQKPESVDDVQMLMAPTPTTEGVASEAAATAAACAAFEPDALPAATAATSAPASMAPPAIRRTAAAGSPRAVLDGTSSNGGNNLARASPAGLMVGAFDDDGDDDDLDFDQVPAGTSRPGAGQSTASTAQLHPSNTPITHILQPATATVSVAVATAPGSDVMAITDAVHDQDLLDLEADDDHGQPAPASPAAAPPVPKPAASESMADGMLAADAGEDVAAAMTPPSSPRPGCCLLATTTVVAVAAVDDAAQSTSTFGNGVEPPGPIAGTGQKRKRADSPASQTKLSTEA